VCRRATAEDLPAIARIRDEARASLHRHGVDQWQGTYPEDEVFLRDIERGECFVLLHGAEIAGFFTLSTREEPSYAAITDGKWTEGMAYCVLHRAAVAQKYRGGQMAAYLMKCVEAQTLEWGRRCIRTDTHKKNKPMQTLLRESGYRYRGNVSVRVNEGHDPARQGFEKILKGK
jgi:GNAT superfamily N-acetyltransferase